MSGWSGTIKGSGVELEHQLGSGDKTTCPLVICAAWGAIIFNLGTKPLVICAASETTLYICVCGSYGSNHLVVSAPSKLVTCNLVQGDL